MTKAEQARIVAWRLRILRHAEEEPRYVAQTCRYFGISRTAFYRWKKHFDEQGIEWINIPVAWRNPKRADFRRFSEIMDEHQDDHVLVQCAANYRASAMTYLYQVTVEGVPADKAAVDMNAIWDPNDNDTWRAYVDEITGSDQ